MAEGAEEREVKLEVPEDFVLPSLAPLDSVTALDRGDARLAAVYWDTADLGLARAGVGLRHRNGVWTFKGRSRRDGDAVVREEVEVIANADSIPGPVRARIERWIDPSAARPVARLDTVRHCLDVSEDDARAELVHDRVQVLDGTRLVTRFAEVEVEFSAGSGALANRLVGLLTAHGAVLGTTPKLVRALRALGHRLPDATR
ncbi:MAG: CYTH domain-containing protein [Candidatus Dormibacteria bacterium]